LNYEEANIYRPGGQGKGHYGAESTTAQLGGDEDWLTEEMIQKIREIVKQHYEEIFISSKG